MLDTFENNIDRRINSEVKAATAHLHTSIYDDDDKGQKIDGPHILKEVRKLMDRKIDRIEANELLRNKTSKSDTEMIQRSISIVHQ